VNTEINYHQRVTQQAVAIIVTGMVVTTLILAAFIIA
jgi:hypothetical protein